jgi:hypothetical protein
MRSAQGVVSKKYHQCSKDDLVLAYKELFGIAPCRTCQGVDWNGVYKSIIKQYQKLKTIPMSDAKYIWNPAHKGMLFFLKGRPLKVGDPTDQKTLEMVFKDPKRSGLVINNPNYLNEEKIEEPILIPGTKAKEVEENHEHNHEDCNGCDEDKPCPECEEKEKVRKLKEAGKTIDQIKAETGISKTKIKKYLG